MKSILTFFRRQRPSVRKQTRRRFFLERLEDRLTPTANLLSIGDAYVDEGDSGTRSAVFTVTLDQASALPVTVEYFTYPGEAEAWVDYESAWGTLTIAPGQMSGTISVQVLGDTEVESDEVFYVLLENPIGATLTEDYYGYGTIGNDDSATPNDPPVAADDTYEVAEDYILSPSYGSGVLANDFDPELGNLQAILVSGPTHGEIYLDSSGSFYYLPDANYFGTDSFTYRAKDDASLSDIATVSITVWSMDDPIELLAPGPQTTAEEAPLTFSTANGNAITVADIESPRVLVALNGYYGTVTVQNTADVELPYPENNGTYSFVFYADSPEEANAALEGLVFTPDLHVNGTAHLSVLIQDMDSQTYYPAEDWAAIPITVTGVNDPPLAFDDAYELAEDLPFVVSGLGVLQNDYDIEWTWLGGGGTNPPLSAVLVDGPAHGTVTLNSGGGFTYTPDANYFGTDSFTYRAADESLQSNVATVTLTIWSMDDPIEIAAPASQTIAEDTSITFSAANGNAVTVSDIDSPRILVALYTQNAILTLQNTADVELPYPENNGTGSLVFYADNPAEANAALEGLVLTPDANFNGSTFLSVLAQEMGPAYPPSEAWVGVPITITAVNDAPVAVNDSYAAEAGVPFWATLGGGGSGVGVLMNDQDVDWDMLTAVLVSGPAHGTLEFNSDGTFTYIAEETYSGTDTFTYRAFDGQVESGLATATFTVTRNLPPVSAGDNYSVNEDGTLNVPAIGVLGNDSDPNGSPLSAHLVSGPAHGTLTLYANGGFTYTPAANYSGADEFWYRAFDGRLYGEAVAVSLIVNPVNDVPTASGEIYSVDEDGVLSISAAGVLANDADIDGPTLSAVLVSGPSHGVLNLNADGSFTYTPTANYNGSDSFTYRANDGQANSNIATVSLTINPINDAPVAVNDAYSVNEDQTLTVAPLPGVTSLVMFSQPGDYIGQGLSYSFTPQTGTFFANRNFDNGVSVFYSGGGQSWNLRFAAPFDVNLTPGHYANATRFPFQAAGVPGLSVSGNGRGSNTLTGHFTVTQAVYAANGDVLRFAATFEQHSEGLPPALTGEVKINQGDGVSGILYNDSDVEGNPFTIIVTSNPEHGTLSMNVDGSFSYTPHANYHGADSFTYKLSDGTSESNLATVSLTVNPVNDFPTANHDSYTVAEDNVLTVAAPGVLANDFDVDGESLTATLVTSPTHGSLVFNANGSFVYTPQVNYSGSDSFQYAARDSGGSFSFIRTVTLTVTSVNDAPVAGNDSYTTAEDTPLTVAAAGLLANDADLESTALSALLVAGPAHGTLTLNGDGSFTYTPDANYHGTDSFTYKASDGAADSNVATVSLTVSAVDDAPTAADDAYSVAEDQTLVIAASGVLGNDTDVESSLTATLVSGPAHGTLTLNADGSFTYTAHANFHGTDSFTYKANDGSLDSNVATVSLTVASVADAPTAADDAYTVDEDNSLTIAAGGVLANDGDVDGDSLSAVLVNGPAHGTLTLNSDGSFTYTPHANFHGTDSFTYKTHDGGLDSNIATVSLTISAVNDAPTASDDDYGLVEDQSLTIAAAGVLASDGDVDGDALSALLVSGPAHGTLTLNADGSFTYTANANYNGSDSFTYKANDGSADSQTATVSLTISAVNDAPVAVAGLDRQTDEGATATFDALGSFDVDGDNLAYSWDFGDGNTASGFSVQHAYADEGTYTVTLTVSDGIASTTDTVEMTVLKVAPLATLSGAVAGVRGQTQTFTFGALDPSPADQAADFIYSINWGDGSTQTVSGPDGSNVDHVYAATGTYTVSVQATDKDGALGDVIQHTITISAVLVQNGNLLVGGTTNGDTINLKVADTNGGVRVTINGATQGVYNPSGAIFVYAQAGTDNVKFETTKFNGQTRYIQDAAFVFGGDGNDTLDARGSSAKNVIVGGAGNDTIWGGTDRDILMGGLGTDTLRGGTGDDLLIGNGTVYDANLDALAALIAEWGRTDANYSVRTSHLLGEPGGLNDGYFLNPDTIPTDSAIDQLYGEGGLDLFFNGFSSPADAVNDLSGGEMKVGL